MTALLLHDFSPSFADQSAAQLLLRSGSPHEVACEGGGDPCNPIFRVLSLSRSGAEASQPTRKPPLCTTLCPAPRSFPACVSTLPAGRSPKSGSARGRHHTETEVAYGSLGRAAQAVRSRVGQGLQNTECRAAPQSIFGPLDGGSAARCLWSGAVGPCGSAANLPTGDPNRQPSIADGASGRVVLCPSGRRMLAWVPASALGLLGPILRRNGLVVGEERDMHRWHPVPMDSRTLDAVQSFGDRVMNWILVLSILTLIGRLGYGLIIEAPRNIPAQIQTLETR